MKILLSSYHFSPSVGGIETVSALLATEFTRRGHLVKLITETCEPDSRLWPFPVHRCPRPKELLRMVQWCDIFFHNNISLRAAWPLLILPRRWFVAHHTWIARPDGTIAWQDKLKKFLLRFAGNISIANGIADRLPVSSVVVGNPYQEEIFQENGTGSRSREFIYLGRLVSDKGIDLALNALSSLKEEGCIPRLTIAGSGPEEASLKALAVDLRIDDQVDFVGPKRDRELVQLLNQHMVMIVPSRWAEPFGIVALEGIACGCVIIGSANGGLPEAIGPCGITFQNGNVDSLATAMRQMLTDPELMQQCRGMASSHLGQFTSRVVAEKYLELFQDALR